MADEETRYMMITMAIPMKCRCVCGEMHDIEPEDLEWALLALGNKTCHKCEDNPLFQINIMPGHEAMKGTKH